MHPRNKLRLLAGVPMDPELERSQPKKIEESVQRPLMEEGESLIDEGMDPYKALDGAMQAIQSVIKHLEKQIHLYHDNPTVVKTDKKDHAAYERVLSLLHKGNMNGAKHAYHDMDTAARELLSEPQAVPKKAQRRAAATLFGYHLLKEGIGMDMLLGRKGKQAVRKLLNPDIEKSALTLYNMLREKGREAFDARHVAATTFGMDDRTFMDVLLAAGINEEEDPTNDENVEEFLAEYNYTGGDAIKSKLMQLYKMDPMAYRELKPKLEEMFHNGGDTAKIEYEIEAALANLRGGDVQESMQDYSDNYNDSEEDEEKPINVADGSSNDEQVYDDMERKPESPNQLEEPGSLSVQNNSDYDQDVKMTVPSNITGALKTEADKARKESEKLDIRDKMSAQFYRDLARAFDDLRGHLEKGTVYDVKKAQVFAQTLMGPMLHKIPNEVWKFLTNAGKTRSLKDYMKEVGNDAKLKKGFDSTKEKAT